MAGGGTEGATNLSLEYTPTWIVAAVCSAIVIVSLIFERLLHYGGKLLKKRNQKSLFDALQKIKEELMLVGFISLLITVLQGSLQKICVRQSIMNHLLPCSRKSDALSTSEHLAADFFTGALGGARRLLASGEGGEYCAAKGKVPIISVEALHQLHIFIFVLAVTHVVLSAITVVLGLTQINNWWYWERSIQQELAAVNGDGNSPEIVRQVEQFKFIQKRYKGFDKAGGLYGWLHSFFKQFYGSVTEEDYATMRLGFIMTHCPTNKKFNFYKYMLRALEADFKKVVGISWYFWSFVMLFLLLNVNGWHIYFWISWIPLLMLLVVGAKLEHIITELAHEVAEKHAVLTGDLIVTPSNTLFWFGKPKIVLVLIHFILFQNAFEIAYFFWAWPTYGFNSCIMGQKKFLIPRLVISVVIQLLCSYCTLPLYAIVSHMGSSFKRAIFEEHVQAGLLGWAAKHRKGKGHAAGSTGTGTAGVQMTTRGVDESSLEQGTARLIPGVDPATPSPQHHQLAVRH